MNSNNEIGLKKELFTKSFEMDNEIYLKLSGLLINNTDYFKMELKNCFQDTKPERIYFQNILLNSKNVSEEITKNQKLFLELFNNLNEERVLFRTILKKLLIKSFWKIRENNEFFQNKVFDLKNEVMLKKIENLEEINSKLKKILVNKENIISSLFEENKILKKSLTENQEKFKTYLLNNNSEEITERTELLKTPKKSERKIVNKQKLIKSCQMDSKDKIENFDEANLKRVPTQKKNLVICSNNNPPRKLKNTKKNVHFFSAKKPENYPEIFNHEMKNKNPSHQKNYSNHFEDKKNIISDFNTHK